MTDVNIQPVSSQQQSRIDPGPQQEPRMGDTPLDMSQFTRPSTSHSQLRAQLPAAPYISREPAGASQPLFPVHTYVVPNQPKQRGNYQKAAAFAIRNSSVRPQQFFVQRRGQELIPDEGPTVKQHLQQQQKQMKERMVAERLYAESGNPNHIPDGLQRTEQTTVVKTFTVVQMPPMNSAPVGIAPPRTVPVPPKNRSRPNNHEPGAPPPPRSRKKANPAGTRQLKVIVSPGVNTGFVSSSSAKQQLATAPYVVQTQPLPPTTSASMPSTSNGPPRKTSFGEGHAKVVSAPARRHLSADVPTVEYHHTSTQYHSTTEPSTPSIDMSSQPSNGLDLIGNDPFLDTNGFDDLDMNDIVPFNVGDVNWNFQFDDSQIFSLSNDEPATQNHFSDKTDPPMQPLHQDKNQFAKDSNHFSQQQPNHQMISGNTIKPRNAPSTSKDDHSLPDDFLAPIPEDKSDPLASLLGDDITALMENDPLLAQVDERAILNDAILNDFPDMLLGDAALRNVLNDGNDVGDADSPDVISLIDWVTNDDHGIGEDEEDFIQNLRDERLENSAPEFLNICGAVQFPSTFDNEPVNPEPSTSANHMSNRVPPPTQGPQKDTCVDHEPKITVDHEPRPSTSNSEATPSRSRRKQRSPKEEKEKPPKIDKKRQEKEKIDAIEKEKEARQQAADRERVRQIMEMQQKQIAMEQMAAEAQQKNGGTPARSRARNRSQAARNHRQTQRQQQQHIEHPPRGPLVISPQKQAPPPPVAVHSVHLPGPSTVPSHPPPPYQPSAVPMPPSAGMRHGHYVAASQHPQPVQVGPPSVTPVAAPASVPVMAPPAQPAVTSHTEEQGVPLNMRGASRPPRPFSEDSGQKFYRNHHEAPANELRRVASWDGNNDVPIPEEHRSGAPVPTQPIPQEEVAQFVTPTATVPGQPLPQQPVMQNAEHPEPAAKTTPAEPVDDSPEAALEDLQKHPCYADLQKAILSGNDEQMEAAVQKFKIQEDEQLQEFNELPTDVLWSMVENPRALFSQEELQQLKENLGVDIEDQIQPEDLLNPEGVDKPQELSDEQEPALEMSRTLILSAMLLNTNEEKEEELVYMENMVAEEEKCTEEYYAAKLKMLKECMHSLCYANAALVDEISRLSGRIIVTTEERKILARRHCHHQRNYIRRLQTASKRKTEAEKKRQELLQKNPGMALPLDLKKLPKMEKEAKAPQERSKNAASHKKKKEPAETTKKSASTGETPKKTAAGGEAKPKAEKRKRGATVVTQDKVEKPEKPPRRNSIEGGTPRKKARTQSDATKAPVDLNSKQSVSASSNHTPTTPVRTGQRPSAVPVVNNPTVNGTVTEQMKPQKLKSPVPSAAPHSEASTTAATPAQPTTPSSTASNPDTPISLRKSARRSAQNINFSEVSPRGTPEPEDSRSRRKPRPTKAATPVNPDETGAASKRKRPRKSDTPLRIPRNEDDTHNPPNSDAAVSVDSEKAATEPEARPANVVPVSPVVAVEKPPLPYTVTPVTPKELANYTENEAAVEQLAATVESPQTSAGGSEPQDTTTSPDTPASNESEEKSGRSMRPRRQSQLRQTSEMLEMFEDDFDDEFDRRKKRRPRTSSETPKRQSTRTRRS